jgi:hypothetical protein
MLISATSNTGTSLIASAVARYFSAADCLGSHTHPRRRANRVCLGLLLVQLFHPNWLSPFFPRFIDSVLPTNHLFGHERP